MMVRLCNALGKWEIASTADCKSSEVVAAEGKVDDVEVCMALHRIEECSGTLKHSMKQGIHK